MSSEGTAFNSCILDMASRRDSVVEFDAGCTADDLTNASHTRDEYQQHPSLRKRMFDCETGWSAR